MWKRIVLTGFSGTGKSTVALNLASELGWDAVDIDQDLEELFGKSIPEVFDEHGESTFREAERGALVKALSRSNVVVATGGGACASNDAWSAELIGDPETLSVSLDACPDTIIDRLVQQEIGEGETTRRPMLAGSDPKGRVRDLKARRQHFYDRANITLAVDAIGPHRVASAIHNFATQPTYQVKLDAPGGKSTIEIGRGSFATAGERIAREWEDGLHAWIISDTNVATHYADILKHSLESAGIGSDIVTVPPGESSKSLSAASNVYDRLLDGEIERKDIVIALGGGVVGDLAGFVAATVLRGVRLVQIPTSLLAMVDSSVGGKTGINHAAGKNLIGSFYQPPLVLIDPEVLTTLPPRELSQGWAENIKHAVIQDSTPASQKGDLSTYLERNADRLLSLEDPALTYLIARNVGVKASVVEADEREAGIRAYLNFGHTLGHAVEASDYQYLHGEAVSIGMHGAAEISVAQGHASPKERDRLLALIERFGLPTRGSFDPAVVVDLIRHDKKRSAGTQRWVVISPNGGVQIDSAVPESAVHRAIERISL